MRAAAGARATAGAPAATPRGRTTPPTEVAAAPSTLNRRRRRPGQRRQRRRPDLARGDDKAPPSPDAPRTGGPCGPVDDYAGSRLDPRTCLVWQNEKLSPRTNVEAARACDQLVLDGFSDWRVPPPRSWPPGPTSPPTPMPTSPTRSTFPPPPRRPRAAPTTVTRAISPSTTPARSPAPGKEWVSWAPPSACAAPPARHHGREVRRHQLRSLQGAHHRRQPRVQDRQLLAVMAGAECSQEGRKAGRIRICPSHLPTFL